MKKALLIITLMVGTATADFVPVYTNAYDIRQADRSSFRVEWFQANSYRRLYQFTLDGSPLSLTNASVVTWTVLSSAAPYETYIAKTATVVSATSGHVYLDLDPWESNLSVGRYRGFVIARELAAGTSVVERLLVREAIEVMFSDDASGWPWVGPLQHSSGIPVPTNWPAGWLLTSINSGATTEAVDPATFAGVTEPQVQQIVTNTISSPVRPVYWIPFAPTVTVLVANTSDQIYVPDSTPSVVAIEPGPVAEGAILVVTFDIGTNTVSWATSLYSNVSYEQEIPTSGVFSVLYRNAPNSTNWSARVWSER